MDEQKNVRLKTQKVDGGRNRDELHCEEEVTETVKQDKIHIPSLLTTQIKQLITHSYCEYLSNWQLFTENKAYCLTLLLFLNNFSIHTEPYD